MDLNQFIGGLDFNSYERTVLIYLSAVDSADAKLICKNASVPYGRIYSVLNSLRDKGFIVVIPVSPKRYQIEDIKQALRNYVLSKKHSFDEKLKLISGICLKPKTIISDKEPSVKIFIGKEEHMNALVSMRATAKKEVLQMAPAFAGTFASVLSFRQALKRGVKMRLLIRSVDAKNRKNVRIALLDGAEVRQLDSDELMSLCIRDRVDFLLGVQVRETDEKRVTMYSKNRAVLNVLAKTFEDFWTKARPLEKLA